MSDTYRLTTQINEIVDTDETIWFLGPRRPDGKLLWRNPFGFSRLSLADLDRRTQAKLRAAMDRERERSRFLHYLFTHFRTSRPVSKMTEGQYLDLVRRAARRFLKIEITVSSHPSQEIVPRIERTKSGKFHVLMPTHDLAKSQKRGLTRLRSLLCSLKFRYLGDKTCGPLSKRKIRL